MKSLKSMLNLEALKKIKRIKKDQLVIFLLFGVLLLVIAIPTEDRRKNTDGETEDNGMEPSAAEAEGKEDTDLSYERRLEERLKEALQKVEGVGEVEVMITLKASSERIVEKDQPSTSQTVEEQDAGGGSRSTEERGWSETTVYREDSDGSRTPYVIKEMEPQVEGVLVIAGGGGSPEVKQNIMEAVQALFSIDAHKIKIMKMEG